MADSGGRAAPPNSRAVYRPPSGRIDLATPAAFLAARQRRNCLAPPLRRTKSVQVYIQVRDTRNFVHEPSKLVNVCAVYALKAIL
ncbi:unnamed protein product, partial [Iphiclides podalirius]